jgi:hypothetical protein
MAYYPQNEEGRLSVGDARLALKDSGLVECLLYRGNGLSDVRLSKRVIRDFLTGQNPEWDSGIAEITLGPGKISLRLEILGGY